MNFESLRSAEQLAQAYEAATAIVDNFEADAVERLNRAMDNALERTLRVVTLHYEHPVTEHYAKRHNLRKMLGGSHQEFEQVAGALNAQVHSDLTGPLAKVLEAKGFKDIQVKGSLSEMGFTQGGELVVCFQVAFKF